MNDSTVYGKDLISWGVVYIFFYHIQHCGTG